MIPIPEIGEEVTVAGEKVYNGIIPCYILQEYTCPISYMDWLYDQRNFAPLSDLDETTLVNEEWEEKVCVPVKSNVCG